MNRVCPLLGLAGDRRSAIDGTDAAHRCHAQLPALAIERQWQAKYCLTTDHPQCERYQQAMARRGTAVLGRAPIGDGLVSTRMLLAPEPAWRGMAGRARRAGPRRAAAIGGALSVLGVGAVAVVAVTSGGQQPASPGLAGSPTDSISPSAVAEATSTPTPTAEPTATASPTPTPTPTRAPATPVPAAITTPPPQQSYVVQEGDTLAAIAEQFGTTVEALQAANDIEDPDSIVVGDVLVIP